MPRCTLPVVCSWKPRIASSTRRMRGAVDAQSRYSNRWPPISRPSKGNSPRNARECLVDRAHGHEPSTGRDQQVLLPPLDCVEHELAGATVHELAGATGHELAVLSCRALAGADPHEVAGVEAHEVEPRVAQRSDEEAADPG